MSDTIKTRLIIKVYEGVVSKETMVLRRWGSSIQKFGFINGVDNVNWPPYRDSLYGGQFTLSTPLIKPNFCISKFMPTVSCMRPPLKYHSKLAKSIASIDLKTKPCKCTKTKTTHTCALPFVVKICNDQYIM